jgi:hypothetical protein
MEGASSVSFDCNAAVSKDNDDAADDVDDSALLAAAIMRKEGMRPRHRAIAILVLSPSSFVLSRLFLCHFQKDHGVMSMSVVSYWQSFLRAIMEHHVAYYFRTLPDIHK